MSFLIAAALLATDPVIAPWDTERRLAALEKDVAALKGKSASPALLPGQTHPFLYNVGDNVNHPTGPGAAQFYAAGGANMGLLVGSAGCPCNCTNCVCQTKAISAPTTETTVKEKKHKTVVTTRTTSSALDQLNRKRAQRGLRPYAFDEGLTRAAEKCASIRMANHIEGHLTSGMGDFECLEPGVTAAAAGAGALTPDWGFATCAMYENWTHAGAAAVMGNDGRQYCSLFVNNAPSVTQAVSATETVPPTPTTMAMSCANGTCSMVPQSFGGPFMSDCVGGICSSGSCASGNCGSSSGRGRRGRR